MPATPRNAAQGALALGLTLALLAAGCGSGATLSAKALLQEAKSLRSEAAEGALLAQDAAAGRTTRIYTRVHSADLYKAASQAASSLQKAKTTPALEPKLRRTARLAQKVSADLKRLGHAPRTEQRTLARELTAAAKELK
ncbi:MAG: hypothetical protein M3R26_01305 [Actinomycetota bacterium]|nr:hypothetical protein [Actinomycetota bacterium]